MMPITATPGEQLRRDFSRFLRRVRRRGRTIIFLRYWAPSAAICVLLGVAASNRLMLDAGAAVGGALVAGLFIAGGLSLRRRSFVNEYLALVDRHFDASGRIVAAAEFIENNEPLDAFKRLAVEDAAKWVRRQERRGLPWITRTRRTTAPVAALLLATVLVTGCESPQPTTPHKPATEPEKPGLYPAPARARLSEIPKSDGERTGNATDAKADQSPMKADEPEDGAAGTGLGEAPGPEPGPGPGETPEPAATPSDTPSTGGAGRPDDAPPPTPIDVPPPPAPASAKAGEQTGPKQEDQQDVEAPEEEVQARAVNDDTPSMEDEIVEGEGEDFTEGEKLRPADSLPTPPFDYRDARRQDLTRERVSPARRELIERYFEKLNQNKSGAASQPASQPTSRPATRPARKDQNDE